MESTFIDSTVELYPPVTFEKCVDYLQQLCDTMGVNEKCTIVSDHETIYINYSEKGILHHLPIFESTEDFYWKRYHYEEFIEYCRDIAPRITDIMMAYDIVQIKYEFGPHENTILGIVSVCGTEMQILISDAFNDELLNTFELAVKIASDREPRIHAIRQFLITDCELLFGERFFSYDEEHKQQFNKISFDTDSSNERQVYYVFEIFDGSNRQIILELLGDEMCYDGSYKQDRIDELIQ